MFLVSFAIKEIKENVTFSTSHQLTYRTQNISWKHEEKKRKKELSPFVVMVAKPLYTSIGGRMQYICVKERERDDEQAFMGDGYREGVERAYAVNLLSDSRKFGI